MKANKVITIGREFGSGGREIGVKLAERLGIPFYDKEIISMAAEAGGLNASFIEAHEEKAPMAGATGMGRIAFSSFSFQPTFSDTIFIAQCNIIKELAAKGPCVIVGRCADYSLRGTDALHVFVRGTTEYKIARKRPMAPEKADYTDAQMQKWMESVDKQRAKYYEHYTDTRWGDSRHYDLCINTDGIGCDGAVELILKRLELE